MVNELRFISGVVYRLKRRYGEAIDIYYRVSSATDLETGLKTVVAGSVRVARAILLPTVVHREFQYDLTFIATNKNFTYGGLYDTSERRIIFDRKDLGDFEITVGMWVVFKNRRYDVKTVEEFEDNSSYFIVVKQAIDAQAPTGVFAAAYTDLLLESEAAEATALAVFAEASSTLVLGSEAEDEL